MQQKKGDDKFDRRDDDCRIFGDYVIEITWYRPSGVTEVQITRKFPRVE